MKTEHVFALIALISGIVGGVLLCKEAIDVVSKLSEARGHISLESPLLVEIGSMAIMGSVVLWTERYLAGGGINMVLGIITVFCGKEAEGLLILMHALRR